MEEIGSVLIAGSLSFGTAVGILGFATFMVLAKFVRDVLAPGNPARSPLTLVCAGMAIASFGMAIYFSA